MAGQVSVKTFKGGMNKDVDLSLLGEDQYTHAENYKLVADEDSNGYILENAEGNSLWLDLDDVSGLPDDKFFDSADYYLVGHTFIKPYLVLFYTSINQDTTPSGGTSLIVRATLGGDKIQEATVIYTDGVDYTYLNLSTTYPISAVGYYEAPDNVKVYWTDEYNSVRVANIMDENLSSYTAGMLDITPDFPVSSSVQIRPTIASTLVNGSMEACSVQYAYQYFIKEGVQTLWSPASTIQIIPENKNQLVFGDYIGGDEDTTTGYGVKVSIEIPSENLYSHMRVVAIQYDTYNGVPQIRILEEVSLDTGTLYTHSLTDVGNSIGEITYEEFSISSNVQYRAKTLSIKDNRLFLGNISEDFYDVDDFDCRAYRHNEYGAARIFESDLSTYVDLHNVTEMAALDEDHDCINRYNNNGDETAYPYIYQGDGATIGAEGINISVQYAVDTLALDTTGLSSTTSATNNITIGNTSSYLHQAGRKSFARQEVYRIGIIFRNVKMQASPVKWICDMKMPTYTDDYSTFISFSHLGSDTVDPDISYAIMLGLKVTVSNFASTGATSWEIVYVPRDSSDRGVLGQGLLQPTLSYSSGSYYGPVQRMDTENPNTSAGFSNVTMFISPEVSFNKNLEYRAGDYYQKIGYFSMGTDSICDQTGAYEFYHYKVNTFYEHDGNYDTDWEYDIDGGQVISYDTNITSRYSLSTNTVTPYNQASGDYGISGTFFGSDHTSSPGTYFFDTTTLGLVKVPVVNYKRNVFSSQYGGPSYLNRQYNTYVSISNLSQGDGDVTTFEGDTFIDYYWHLKQSQDLEETEADLTNGSSFLFPVESSISPRLSHSDYIYRHLTSARHRLMQEIAGTQEGDVNGSSYVLEQELPLYLYNSVYSQTPMSTLLVADSDDFEVSSEYPIRIINSDYKTNNEELDSFTQFSVNNFIDLDGSKGKINNIKTFKNKLFFWQDNGFGVASVNPRSLIQDGNVGALSLGTGGILERFDYISDDIGNQNQFGIVASRKSLYWVDNNKNEIVKYTNDVDSVSKLAGIQTWVNSNGKIGDVKAVYDHKYNDAIFTMTFNRELNAEFWISGTVLWWSILPTTDLSSLGTYDAIINARYENEESFSNRNTFYYSGVNSTLGSRPYGEVGSKFYIAIDQDPTTTYTVSFNEKVNKFVSFNSFTPGRYIEIDSGYYSTNDYHDLYHHNDDDATRATYYGTTYDSIVTAPFTKDYAYTKTFDGLKWFTESYDSDGINQFADTFQSIEMYNEYQITGDRTLVVNTTPAVGETEVTRRERTWSMNVPRNIMDVDVSDNPDIHDTANHDETQLFKERMRDKFLTCKFTYDNGDGNVFSVPFISTVYRRSVR